MRLKFYLNESITTKNAASQFIKQGDNIVPIIKMEKVDGKLMVFVKGKSYLRNDLVWTGKKQNGGAIWRELGLKGTNTGPIRMKKKF